MVLQKSIIAILVMSINVPKIGRMLKMLKNFFVTQEMGCWLGL